MAREMRWHDYVTINALWFALTARAQLLTPLILPLLVQRFVGEAAQGAYVGQTRLWGLMAALLVQALMGLLSDRTRHPWGRRRPFILAGSLSLLVVLVLIGFTTSLEGMAGYWTLSLVYVLSMVTSDTVLAAAQGLIPDLVPENKRGLASGIKTILELPLPLLFLAFVGSRLVSAANLWGALAALMVALVICTLLSMLVREQPLGVVPRSADWGSLFRLVLMTAAFTLIILATGGIVRFITRPDAGLSPNAAGVFVALVGLLSMSIAMAFGVWAGIRIGIGLDARKRPSFTWWVVNRLAFLVPSFNLAGFFLFFLQNRFPGLERERAAGPAATAVLLLGMCVLLTAPAGGWLADRHGKKPLIGMGGLLAATGTFVVVGIVDLRAVYAGACLVGAAVGLFYSASWALGTEIVPREEAGRYLGLSNLAGAGAGAIGAYLGGPIADRLGFVVLFALYGVIYLLSILALMGIHDRS